MATMHDWVWFIFLIPKLSCANNLGANKYCAMIKQIWLEKYRPKVLNDVHGNTEIVDSLKVCVEQGKRLNNVGSVPHLILTGPPGVGKTSTVLCMARMLLGDKEKEAVKELNASDERGLEVVREEIKSFAVKKVNLPPNRTKVMILDEADSMTEGAQQALRMIISSNSDSTRFVLCCNDSGKIIDAIQSRCIVMRFSRLSDDDVRMNLKRIIENEKVLISENALKSLLFIADGDMRKAVNNLQACYQFLPNKASKRCAMQPILSLKTWCSTSVTRLTRH